MAQSMWRRGARHGGVGFSVSGFAGHARMRGRVAAGVGKLGSELLLTKDRMEPGVKILLVNNLFQPEPNHLKGLAFAVELRRRGHEVHVLTGFPNYPGGAVYPGYRVSWTFEEELDGIPVKRVAMYASHDHSGFRRALNFVSLGASQALHCLTSRKRFDLCHVYMGPITLMWPALVLRARHGTKVVADVQDLWPESVMDSGMLRSPFAGRALDWLSRTAYRSADHVLVLSPGYRQALCDRGVEPRRVDVVYNWCDERQAPEAPEAAAELVSGGAFHVVYAGNLGRLQGIDTVLDAAKLIAASRRDVRFLLVGGGVEAERLRLRVADERLTNVRMPGRLPSEAVNGILRRAGLLLVHLESRPLTRLGIPQKVQAYLAAGSPLLVAAEGDAADLVRRSGAGVICSPNDPAAMARAILEVLDAPEERIAGMRRAGVRYYRDELSFDRGVDRIESIFRKVLRTPEGSSGQA